MPEKTPLEELNEAVVKLYFEADSPTHRWIAGKAGVDQSSVSGILRMKKGLPRWRTLAPIVVTLGGDKETFLRLWLAAEESHGRTV